MRFFKYHALGNDYLVLPPSEKSPLFSPSEIERICHRHFGLGSDGILYGPLKTDRADFGLQIWNPDGSEAEKSGNGLRIFARYLFDQGLVGESPFTVETPGGVVKCEVREKGQRIRVEMGRVSFDSTVIPVSGEPREVINETVEINGTTYTYCAATVGNPHVVVVLDDHSPELAHEIGPVLENMTERFPNRTNVQLLKVLDRGNIQIEIWERGAGYTLASGSSSSAAAAVAHKLGLCDSDITVHMPGGVIRIEIDADFGITMTGPTTAVGVFELNEEIFSFRA
ncbi:MAG: diaminopimelate epimerase [Verrucomicrobia bacterium]|nr:MAG: diaminopimelate epimerase [Verrucomicrobiota bacterium]